MDTGLKQVELGQYINNLVNKKYCKISCGLSKFPAELLSIKDTLEVLDLSNNLISELPDFIKEFPKLRILFLTNNQFEVFPKSIQGCETLEMLSFKSNKIHTVPTVDFPSKLRWLILTDNQISDLPETLGNCLLMQKMMLAGNQLSSLPNTFSNFSKLELLRISNNQLTYFPEQLYQCHSLRWIAFASNPFVHIDTPIPFSTIEWAKIKIGEQLGSGASGITFKAHIEQDNTQEYALKLYQSLITSDGKMEDEFWALKKIGKHINLPKPIAEVRNAPDGQHSILFELITNDYKILAQPPSLDTCSRDVYPAGFCISESRRNAIIEQMKNAMNHLREKEIAHGDFYAHNIMVNPEGHAILTDFGAATDYASLTKEQKYFVQKVEQRSFETLEAELNIIKKAKGTGN